MKSNMGSADKFVRSMVGIALLLNIYILEPGTAVTLILLIPGLALIATAWTGYCPAYAPLGISTCDKNACAGGAEETEKEKFEFKVVCNMNGADRLVRLLIGLAFLANIFVLKLCVFGYILFVLLGIAFIASAWFSYCPLYQFFGISTCSEKCCEK